MINSLSVRDNAIEEDEILIAIPVGLTGRLCKDLAGRILADPGFGGLVERLRRRRKVMGGSAGSSSNNRRRKKEMVVDVRRRIVEDDGGGGSFDRWRKGQWWIGWLVLGVPVGLLLLWMFVWVGMPKERGGFVFNDIGLSKLVNVLVDDVDRGI